MGKITVGIEIRRRNVITPFLLSIAHESFTHLCDICGHVCCVSFCLQLAYAPLPWDHELRLAAAS
jgi:hypothetical protein